MEPLVLSGRTISAKIKNDIKEKVSALKKKPGLAVVTVGDDPASKVYVRNKEKACGEVGYIWRQIALPEQTSEEKLFSVIKKLNTDSTVHGILVQVPLPPAFKSIEEKLVYSINPDKDVDAFHPFNVGRFVSCHGESCDRLLLPCTPNGIIRILEEYQIPIAGKHVVILGRSKLVGKPVSLLFLARDATVTICHSKTKNLSKITKEADILVVAVGKPLMIDAGYIKKGIVVVDVGINWTDKGIVGDVDFASVKNKVKAITPVPGGIGPMTIAMLLENVLKAYQNIEHD